MNMNNKFDKIKQIILYKLQLGLKKLGWSGPSSSDDNLDKKLASIESGNNILLPMTVDVDVEAVAVNQKMKDTVTAYVTLYVVSDDNVTFYPEMDLIANLNIPNIDADVQIVRDHTSKNPQEGSISISIAFTEKNLKEDDLINRAIRLIDEYIKEYIQHQYIDFVEANENAIELAAIGANPEPVPDKLDEI